MGTRADFYVGEGDQAEWLGSIAFDGYPSGIPGTVLEAKAEQEYRDAVLAMLRSNEHNTTPDQGWPWPWEDSGTTDYAYVFLDGQVECSHFASPWYDPQKEVQNPDYDPATEPGDPALFPNMKDIQNVTFGKRSGLLILRLP